MTNPSPEALLPLKPVSYLILLALAEGDCHAYALKKAVARQSENRVQLGPATLHRHLKSLLNLQLIEFAADRPPARLDDERRRYYAITDLGRRAAVAETDRLAALVRAARKLTLQ